MKIKVDLQNEEISYEREPIPKGRFNAICCVLCMVLYMVMVSVAGAIMGFEGGVIAALFGLFICGGVVLAILCIEDKE